MPSLLAHHCRRRSRRTFAMSAFTITPLHARGAEELRSQASERI
jgi:hypothetical protein